jgi:hypothetical protein
MSWGHELDQHTFETEDILRYPHITAQQQRLSSSTMGLGGTQGPCSLFPVLSGAGAQTPNSFLTMLFLLLDGGTSGFSFSAASFKVVAVLLIEMRGIAIEAWPVVLREGGLVDAALVSFTIFRWTNSVLKSMSEV